MNSILQDSKECIVCHKQYGLHYHHCFFGKNRKNSDDNGFTCWLCYEHHEGTYGVHGREGKPLDTWLKRLCQAKYEETHTRTEFREIIGKSFL